MAPITLPQPTANRTCRGYGSNILKDGTAGARA
jgi:hypothetical protein